MRGITKRFPGVLANDQVDFEALPGEVHALLGENGAGKSTLSNILTGLYRPDEGEMLLYGKPATFHAPRDAIDAGVGMVHQHFRLAASFTVAENLVLGHRDAADRGLLLEPRVVEGRIGELSRRYRMPVNPRARIWQLSVGEQQRVEILKVLYRGARILILDEPTSQLTPQEADDLFQTLRLMAAEQRTIIFISHKLEEVMAVSNRVTVLRRGKVIGTVMTGDTNTGELARMMVGRDVVFTQKKQGPAQAERQVALELRQVRATAVELIRRFNIAASSPQTPARQLSGGNIQKVLLARELSSHPRVLVACSPTSGLDVGATDTVRGLLLEAARDGVGILLISEDLDEILALADRIAVLYGGRITGIVERQHAEVEQLGLMMAGAATK